MGYRHEALLYSGPDEFVGRTLPFITEGIEAREPILVVVSAEKITRLRDALNGSADTIEYADMAQVGGNPARIIPAWSDFLERHPGRPARGIGEPIWAERSDAELVECQLHESLLNLAFADHESFTLVCPYDTESLPADVIAEAFHSHPRSWEPHASHSSESYRDDPWLEGPFAEPLPEASAPTEQLGFEDLAALERIRSFVAEHGKSHGLSPARTRALVLAVHEAAANSIEHGGGQGALRIWSDEDTLICELRDTGRIRDPLVGRRAPSPTPEDGRGIWLIQQLADLAQIRSDAHGTTIRIHFNNN